MFSHVTIGSNNLERSAQFYAAVLGVLGGYVDNSTIEYGFVASTTPGDVGPRLIMCLPLDDKPATAGSVFAVGIDVACAADADRVCEIAAQAGGEVLAELNGDHIRMLVDPDGNRLEVSSVAGGGELSGVLQSVTTGCRDLVRASSFYSRVLNCLGIDNVVSNDGDVVFRSSGTGTGYLVLTQEADVEVLLVGNGAHIAFTAPSKAAVDAFYATALDEGASCEGPPGLRPHYADNYYAAYVRDPDGTKIQAVSRAHPAAQ